MYVLYTGKNTICFIPIIAMTLEMLATQYSLTANYHTNARTHTANLLIEHFKLEILLMLDYRGYYHNR